MPKSMIMGFREDPFSAVRDVTGVPWGNPQLAAIARAVARDELYRNPSDDTGSGTLISGRVSEQMKAGRTAPLEGPAEVSRKGAFVEHVGKDPEKRRLRDTHSISESPVCEALRTLLL